MEFTGRGRNRGEAVTEHLGPAVSGTLGNMLEGWDVGLEDDGEGGRVELIEDDEALVGADVRAGVPEGGDDRDALEVGLRRIVLRQFPETPGKQQEQGLPPRTQEHLRHFAVPLQRQQRVVRRAGRAADVDVDVDRAVCDRGADCDNGADCIDVEDISHTEKTESALIKFQSALRIARVRVLLATSER